MVMNKFQYLFLHYSERLRISLYPRTIHRSQVQYAYSLGGTYDSSLDITWYQGLKKTDVTNGSCITWNFYDYEFPGEPTLIETSHNTSYLLVIVYNAIAHKSYIHIFNPSQIQRGSLCEIELPIIIPMGLHGSFHDRIQQS